jgi:anti-sigma regulatory factor (Ser/Thr protein kinase)
MKELALHILDIAENSVRASADKINISLSLEEENKLLIIEIADDGVGMSEEVLIKTSNPFFTSRTTRDVGMGIPLFRQHAEMTGGSLKIESKEGQGTCLVAKLHKDHSDIQPIGDIEGCWIMLVSSYPSIEWCLSCKTNKSVFEINSNEIKKELGIENFEDAELNKQLKRMIRNNISEIGFE